VDAARKNGLPLLISEAKPGEFQCVAGQWCESVQVGQK
jgi:hypothetical protein